jgi:triosephosphate isomerase (TIM)
MNISKRRPLVAGNWKLHKTVPGSLDLVRELKHRLSRGVRCEVAVAPVYTALFAVNSELAGTEIRLAAQDVYWENQGAFTGEVSAMLLRDVGCHYVIVGHSERRQLFGETDAGVNKKTKAVLANDMAAIVCMGETREQREAGKTLAIVLSQLDGALAGVPNSDFPRIVIAYEPIWAIGTGLTSSPQDAQAVQSAIRGRISEHYGSQIAESTRILYGGSVKPENAANLMAQPDIDGALVGGASLTAESFVGIVEGAG